MVDGSPKEVKEILRKWLSSNEHSIRELKDDNASFHFEIDFPTGQQSKQHIVQPKKISDLLLIVNSISISPDHQDGLQKMKPDERQSLITSLGKRYVLRDNQYEFNFNHEGLLSGVTFTYPIFFDGLTKNSFYKALDCNFKSYLFLSMTLTELIGNKSSPPQDSSRMYG